MAWTTILSTQTDADSPLNQVLMDSIRENLDYLKANDDLAVVVGDNLQNLGDYAGLAFANVAYGVTHGTDAMSKPFYLSSPGANFKWVIKVKFYNALGASRTGYAKVVNIQNGGDLITEANTGSIAPNGNGAATLTGAANTAYWGFVKMYMGASTASYYQAVYAYTVAA
jgi:hypothetical protein